MDLNMPRCDGVEATPPHPGQPPADPGGRADHLLRRRIDHRRPAGRRARLPDQGRHPGRDRPGRTGRRGRPGRARPGGPAAAAVGRRPRARRPARRWGRRSGRHRPDAARVRGAPPHRGGQVQPGDRTRALRQRGHGQDPRQPDLRQDRLTGPHPGHALRLYPRLRRAAVTCHSGSSRCTSPGSLSIRSPRQLGWRRIPSVVHSANATSPTSRGSTHRHARLQQAEVRASAAQRHDLPSQDHRGADSLREHAELRVLGVMSWSLRETSRTVSALT